MAYPVNTTALLVNGINAISSINIIDGMQVAKISFNSAAGTLDAFVLTPFDPIVSNIELKCGKQVLQIADISFATASPINDGQITVTGTRTDQDGNNPRAFSTTICTWSN